MEYFTAIFFGTSVGLFVMYKHFRWQLTLEKLINAEKTEQIEFLKEAHEQFKTENKNCNIPDVMFSEARAKVCKENEYWKNCIEWRRDCRCLSKCEYHRQT